MRKPALNRKQVEEVIAHYQSGMFVREIGRMYNVSNTTIKNYLKRNGVKLRNPKQEMSRHAKTRNRDKNPFWKGGKTILPDGYVRLSLGNNKTMLEHRYVMEQHIGRELRSDEHVHHINGVKDDNRIENLQLMSASEHCALTGLERVRNGTHNEYIHVEKTELMKLIKEGNTVKDICKRYGFSYRTFYNKIEKFNLKDWYKEMKNNAKSSDSYRKIG